VQRGSETTQQTDALALMKATGMVRLVEFAQAGITASTISRIERSGLVVRLARGLYQVPDATVDTHHTLAEAAKLVPRGVVCLTSALVFTV
jgi:predicted transcriptional regulator of viral defense system